MIRRFFCIFLILNLTVSVFAFAGEDNKKLPSLAGEIFEFIKKKIDSGHALDDSLKDQIVEHMRTIVDPNDFDTQYKSLRAAIKNEYKFEDMYEFLRNSSDAVCKLLNEASQKIKEEHPNEIGPGKTVAFSDVSIFKSKTDVDGTTLNRSKSCSAIASSTIEGDVVKPKQNESDCDKLKSENNQLRTRNNLLGALIESLKNEKNELMDKQVDLSAENGGLREKVSNLEQKNQLNLQEIERLESLNELYEQVVEIYQKITKSKLDFKQIIELMKQIRGKKNGK